MSENIHPAFRNADVPNEAIGAIGSDEVGGCVDRPPTNGNRTSSNTAVAVDSNTALSRADREPSHTRSNDESGEDEEKRIASSRPGSNSRPSAQGHSSHHEKVRNGDEERGHDDKVELKEDQCYDKLGFSWPAWKKWGILSVIFIVQVSMNFNASL